MTLLAQQAAVAIENAELFRQAREAGEGLRAAEKLAALGRLSAGLAHELRNPLNTLSVLTYAMVEQAEHGGVRVSDLEVLQSELRENRDAILHLDHLLQRLDTTGFVVEVVVLLHLGLELTEIHDL